MTSPKEKSLEKKILHLLTGTNLKLAELLFTDTELMYIQDYANTVSIKRLNFNDHGPVHMRKVILNAITIFNLLVEGGVEMNLAKEEVGNNEDSLNAVLLASFLHDIGMTVGRDRHEDASIILAIPIIDRLLTEIYGNDLQKKVIVRSLAVEGIKGHMATQKIHSVEAGIILIADGCDMEKGRSRIPMMINTEPKVGDIHQYSAASIEHVELVKGEQRPIRITIHMSASVGFFQVEEVLFKKINMSPIKKYIEVFAGVPDREMKQYL